MNQQRVISDKMPHYLGKDLEAMSFAKNYHKWILAEFLPYIGTSVAEVGAGKGSFSRLILETDIRNLKAYEPSQDMFLMLEATLKNECRANAVNDFFNQNITDSFDSVLYVNVLEHIEDDASEIVTAHSKLKQNGHLLIFVPALQWLFSDLDRQVGHFRRYTKNNLTELVIKAGFSVVHAKYFDMAGIIPWYINFVLLKNQIDSSSVNLYDKLIVPSMRILESIMAPPLGKNVLLVAKKI